MFKILMPVFLIVSFSSFSFGQKYFTFKDSMLIIGKEYTDTISKDKLMNVDSIAVFDSVNGTDIYPATSYQLVLQTQGRYNQFAAIIGSKFTDKVRFLISGSHKGDHFIIVSIRYRDAKNDNIHFNHAVHIWVK